MLLYKVKLDEFINVVKKMYEAYASAASNAPKSTATPTPSDETVVDLFYGQ